MMAYEITAHGQTDRGRVRAENQDAFLVAPKEQVYVVADGMGGHAGGEIASRLCIAKVGSYLTLPPPLPAPPGLPNDRQAAHGRCLQQMTEAIHAAGVSIYERALEEPSLRGMGTTATIFRVIGDYGYCAHVGDSRLYLLRQGFLYQLTADHSLVSEQMAAGLLTEEEARHHQLRNVITRSVGYQEEELVDSFALPLEGHDRFLLCSDGLHGLVADEDIASMMGGRDLSQAVQDLIQAANARGGDDNITVVLVCIQ